MPPFFDWLNASWAQSRARWPVLIAVLGAGGAATFLGGFVPFIPAGLLTLFGVSPAWAIWGAATAASVLAVLWLSTWAQAAVLRAALTDETAMNSMARAWGQTDAFAWVLTLTLLAVAGGWFLLVVPGLVLSVFFFPAPMIVIDGEARGARALALSWGRVKPHFVPVALRIGALGLIVFLSGRFPYVGWIIAMLMSPFGFVAAARLAKDLKAAQPTPDEPSWMAAAIAALSLVFVIGSAAAGIAAWRLGRMAWDNLGGIEGLSSRVRPETAQSLLDAMGRGDEDAQKKAMDAVLAQIFSSTATKSGTSP